MTFLNKLNFSFLVIFAGIFLSIGCGKDDVKPDGDTAGNKASATILFLDDDKTASFSASGLGAMGGLSDDGLALIFRDDNSPMAFFIIMGAPKVGHFSHEDGTLKGGGWFYEDTANIGMRQIYYFGEDNVDNDEIIDGMATIDISSLANNHIKGTFSMTMVLNSTIKEDGEIIEGEIKRAKVTNGKFDMDLMQ